MQEKTWEITAKKIALNDLRSLSPIYKLSLRSVCLPSCSHTRINQPPLKKKKIKPIIKHPLQKTPSSSSLSESSHMFSDSKRSIGEERRGMMKLEHLVRKLQLVLSLLPSRRMEVVQDHEFDEELEEAAAAAMVPDDVKEGHFAVLAVMGGEPKRFIVDLSHLTNPAFLRLLEQAEEEYGFEQKGTLAVPCQPEELQKILQPRKEPTAKAGRRATCRL